MSRGQPARYVLYQYAEGHYAIDCEPHNHKVANLRADSDPEQVIRLLKAHDTVHEGEWKAGQW
jgi:hypothetical protein